MGATLRYAKVVDRDKFQRSGGLHPGTDNVVRVLSEPPAKAAPFYVIRYWYDLAHAVTESWRIEDRHGRTVREPVTREVLAGQSDLTDEIDDWLVDYADDAYVVVWELDGREVARTTFTVTEEPPDEPAA